MCWCYGGLLNIRGFKRCLLSHFTTWSVHVGRGESDEGPVRFADDEAMVTGSLPMLQRIMDVLDKTEKYDNNK